MVVRASSVALLSAALLAFEVLWLRLFAIQHYHHFAYMAVGVALLGIGASGTALALAGERWAGREARVYILCAAVLAVSLLAAPVAVGLLPFEPAQIVWERRQAWVTGAVELVLAVPFFAGGAALALALQHDPARSAALYGASLAGSGMGAAGALLALLRWPPESTPAAAAVVAVAATALALDREASRTLRLALALLGVAAVAALVRPPWSLEMTPYKPLPQARAYPDVVERGRAWDPTAWAVALEAPALRYAPGLSLGFRGDIPPQVGLFADGEWAGAVTRVDGEPARAPLLDWLPSAAPYAIGARDRVAVLGAGGGLEILSALAHGARRVTAVEQSPSVVRLAGRVAGSRDAPYGLPGVTAVVGDARGVLARAGERFDLVQHTAAGSWGAAAGGLHGLDADYLNTVESYALALRRLDAGGVLAVTRWMRLPPRDNVKVILTAAAALRSLGHDDVGPRLVVLRSWANVVVLVKPDRFTAEEQARLRAFAVSRFFDLDWLAGPPSADLQEFNRLEAPVFADAARAASESAAAAERFIREYPFHVRPATDDRPFFARFLDVGQALAFVRRPASEWAPYAEWGTLVLLATIAQGVLLAGALLLVPAMWARRRANIPKRNRFVSLFDRTRTERRPHLPPLGPARPTLGTTGATLGPVRAALYFGGLGLGYLFVEMALIQRLQLWLGHPVVAVAATLAAFLVLSGLGSLWLQGRTLRATWAAPAVVAAMIPLYVWVLSATGDAPAAFPAAARALVAVLMLVPLGTSMGVPFPSGLRRTGGRTGIAWAWAVNGFASVVAAPAAVLLSMEVGVFGLLWAGALAYALAAAAGAGVAEP